MKHTQVSSNKEFMETLEEMAELPGRAEPGEPAAGRPAELKTFLLESNKGFPSGGNFGDVSYDIAGTGVDALKVLNVHYGDSTCEFFLDVSDKRFFKLHTNYGSADVRKTIGAMVGHRDHVLDNAWFHRGLLERVAKMEGNSLQGIELYSNPVHDCDDLTDLDPRLGGSLADSPEEIVQPNEQLRRAGAYKCVQIMRGKGRPAEHRSYDDVHNDGYFALRRGGSVQDHLHLVGQCKEEYSKTIAGVEKERVYCEWKGGLGELHGTPFDFVFPNGVEDLNSFADGVFSTTKPFQLGGLRQKMDDGRLQVLAVDLRAGSSVDFEIGHDMMQVSFFEQGRGSIILRLLTNLQAHFDADTYCPLVDEIAE